MVKSPETVKMLDELTAKLFGRTRSECIANGICVTCGGKADKFSNNFFAKEFEISGMCQTCQKETFRQ
jgi:hypothetical protein